MASAQFTLSAFADEIADDVGEQAALLHALRIGYVDFRSAWGVNVKALEDDAVLKAKRIFGARGIRVACIGSPIGKSPITDPIENEMAVLDRLFKVGEMLDVRRIRLFSFYPPDTSANARYDDYVEEATARLAKLTAIAARAGFTLLHENERAIVGDTPARCHRLVSGVNSPHLRALWDPANYIVVGVEKPMTNGWALQADEVEYVHVKDAKLSDGSIKAAGEGDGELPELIAALMAKGYRGFLALEPHLALAGQSGGFSGPEGMRYAANALRNLMQKLGAEEAPAFA